MTALSPLPLPLRFYRAASTLLAPLVSLLLRRRIAQGKEDAARLPERFGQASRERPEGPLIWLHAASVGETVSILPLIERLVTHGNHVLLTSGTVTSADLAARRLPAGAFHQFVPVDTPAAASRFLDHWRPDLALFCESEIWPNLLIDLHARAIPVGIINGRMSDRSFRLWRRAPGSARALLGAMNFCLAQSKDDEARYSALGAPARSVGNLKFDGAPLPVARHELAILREAIGDRAVLVAASTHPGEDEVVIAAATSIRQARPDLLTILVPRHPQRGQAIATLLADHQQSAPLRSSGALPGRDDAFYVADTLGELGLFYALATLAFVGGTLVPVGGHNPIEAAKLGAPILHGPHVANARDIYRALGAAHASIEIRHADDLAAEAKRLLADPAARDALASHARAMVEANEGALDRTMEVVRDLLSRESRRP